MTVGIGIISYNSPDDVRECVASIVGHTPEPHDLVIWDNSDSFRTGCWAVAQPNMTYIRSPCNVGCCISRSKLSELFIRRGHDRFVFVDMDVRFTGAGWATDMLAVFQKYPDTGCVAWKFIADQLQTGGYEMDETGATPQVPGACCMWSAECVRAIGGWFSGTMFYRLEDSDACLRAGLKGYRTRLVMGPQKISHDHPCSGMSRNPRDAAIRAYSDAVFQQRARALGFPEIHGVTIS